MCFHPVEIVGRGSETQMGENLNYLISVALLRLNLVLLGTGYIFFEACFIAFPIPTSNE